MLRASPGEPTDRRHQWLTTTSLDGYTRVWSLDRAALLAHELARRVLLRRNR